jgi:hypothetical protein
MTEGHLAILLEAIEAWPASSTNYSRAAWQRLAEAAKEFQSDDPRSVEKALAKFQRTGFAGQRENPGKLLLLMRIVFDVPDSSPINQIHMFAGWVTHGTEFKSDRSANLAWPLKWNNGDPYLVCGFLGIQGIDAQYNAAEEFNYFLGKYPLRDLSNYP